MSISAMATSAYTHSKLAALEAILLSIDFFVFISHSQQTDAAQ
jgi:hypothetical protein